MRVEGATQRLMRRVAEENANLSELSRKSGVPYYRLYRSFSDANGRRELRADEFLSLCACMGVNPGEFLTSAAEPGA